MAITTKECHSLADFECWVDHIYQLFAKQVRVIFLKGELGAGKTAFARRWLYCAGVRARVKSPSFSLIETYEDTSLGVIHHLDLYRLASSDDLRALGLDNYMDDCLLIEWPEYGASQIFSPDLVIEIKVLEALRQCSYSVSS